MKEFNLEEYLKNPSRQVVTRYGKRVRIICTDYENRKPIVGLVKEKEEIIFTFTKDGKLLENGEKSFVDLFFLPIKKEGWINVYKDNITTFTSSKIHATEKKAQEEASEVLKEYGKIIATIKIEWEE